LKNTAEELRSEHRRGDHGPVRAERLGADRERDFPTGGAVQ